MKDGKMGPLSAVEVALHASRESLWVVIDAIAYDLTAYLDQHPGGSASILAFAGADATERFHQLHPTGTLETLPPSCRLGTVTDPENVRRVEQRNRPPPAPLDQVAVPLQHILCLDDMEAAAEKLLSSKAWGYYRSAADRELGHQRNVECWRDVVWRPRILRNTPAFSAQTTILGHRVHLPIMIAPCALARLADPEGEKALCRAAAKAGLIYCMSTNASLRPEDVAAVAESDQVLLYQLYILAKRQQTVDLLERIRALPQFKAIVFTVDSFVGGRRLRDERAALTAAPVPLGLMSPHTSSPVKVQSVNSSIAGYFDGNIDWSDLDWIRRHSGLPVCIKGITTAEDAALAVEHGAAAIWVSNHGARNLESAPDPVSTLLEIQKHAPHVFERCEVYVDGGIRQGPDVLKALCLGARAVALGRPFMYSLAYGEAGVSKVADLLKEEMAIAAQLIGVTGVHQLSRRCVNTKRFDPFIADADLGGKVFRRSRL